MEAFACLSLLIGLVVFIAILAICHWTQKSYHVLLQLNQNMVVLIEEIRGLNAEKEQPHAPVPRIRT